MAGVALGTATIAYGASNMVQAGQDIYHSLVAKDIGVIEKAHENITETDAAAGGAR